MTRLSLALDAARVAGLPADDPLVLGDHSTLVVHLRPADVVARVGRLPEHAARELLVGRHLAAHGAPAVRPLDLPRHGLVSFWHLLPAGAPPAPEQAGAALREVHEALSDLRAPLPTLGTWTAEVPAWLAVAPPQVVDAHALLDADLRLLPPGQALHGDAHLGNCWAGRGTATWGDLEEAGRGPVEWDLAALTLSGIVLGHGLGARALAAYGDHDPALLDRLLPARALLAVAWLVHTRRRDDPYAAFLAYLLEHLP